MCHMSFPSLSSSSDHANNIWWELLIKDLFIITELALITKAMDGVIGIFQWQSFWSHYGPGFDSDSNRNEYQVYFLGVKAAGA